MIASISIQPSPVAALSLLGITGQVINLPLDQLMDFAVDHSDIREVLRALAIVCDAHADVEGHDDDLGEAWGFVARGLEKMAERSVGVSGVLQAIAEEAS